MKIQKYKAKIIGTEEEIVGYIAEIRKYLGNGCYDQHGKDYLMSVTVISMPNSKIGYGSWIVDHESIEPIN